ncbi:MAG: peptidyl-tRNA hydrolase Pth2 [Nanoarchaeota archaeon]|nr:peptidyl-tRNA hydrolase Pth2 [Nanoarchaeota archaeon]MBU1005920.1 peptidyl-tRNA hydrolase Pth2 [Nanoarchaeota archaeon]MBU1946286.1 peptidyl-tRNA hydrolase Pth2 [Nanoarchaeota archaeon]
MAYKQVILVREDLKLPKGKLAVQVAHASSSALIKSHKDDLRKWQSEGMKKVVLKVKDLDELLKFKQQAEDLGLVNSLIEDAGKTVVAPGTVTCLGIGPDKEEKIDKVSGKLKMV